MKILTPTMRNIERAAEALKSGGLVGMPTETVYGIAANATDEKPVIQTFALKKRPAENPLIVHVGSLEQAKKWVLRFPDSALILAKHFWPGPLTLVLPKNDLLPMAVTGGLDTVAIRVPNHPDALALLHASGLPISAPSANAFMGLSPTRAENIAPEVLNGLTYVIDGGPCRVGLESTVVDCTGGEPVILRPGGISRIAIEQVLGGPTFVNRAKEHRSPGMYLRHYSPKTTLRLVDRLAPTDAGIGFYSIQNSAQIQLPQEPVAYAQMLYSSLHTLDQLGRPEILIETPPSSPEWEAVWDRIEKAAGP